MYPILAITLAVAAPGPNEKWEHLPDGRWMFVDPSKPIPDKPVVKTPGKDLWCDYEHQCYNSKDEPTPEAPTTTPPAVIPPFTARVPSNPPVVRWGPKPEFDPYCVDIQHRLFDDLDEVARAHARCERPY